MSKQFKVTMQAFVLLLTLCGGSTYAAAVEDGKSKWIPLGAEKIGEIQGSKTLSDVEIITALTHVLDRRISLAPLAPIDEPGYHYSQRPNPGYEYSVLINAIARRRYPAKPATRPEAVEAVLANFNTLSGIKNKQAVRSLLYVALALAGGDAPESELLRLLNHPDTPEEIIYETLSGMLRSERPAIEGLPSLVRLADLPAKVPVRALPRLLDLVQHPWNYSVGTRPGPEVDIRIYPIREAALACLHELGVEAEKVLVPDNEVDENGKPKLPITLIKVNQRSAAKALREAKRAAKP